MGKIQFPHPYYNSLVFILHLQLEHDYRHKIKPAQLL